MNRFTLSLSLLADNCWANVNAFMMKEGVGKMKLLILQGALQTHRSWPHKHCGLSLRLRWWSWSDKKRNACAYFLEEFFLVLEGMTQVALLSASLQQRRTHLMRQGCASLSMIWISLTSILCVFASSFVLSISFTATRSEKVSEWKLIWHQGCVNSSPAS